MIVRVFRAKVHQGKAEEFARFFLEEALPLVRQQPGLVSADAGCPLTPTDEEFVMVSVWKDLESLRSFCGDDWQEAKILPAERPFLRKTVVHHYKGAQR